MSLVDLFPTLVQFCGLPMPKHMLEGRSLQPLLDRPATRWDRPVLTVYGEQCGSLRDETHRYIRYPDGIEELYDHRVDPHEWNNLAARPEMAAVKQRLAKWFPERWAKSLGGRLG